MERERERIAWDPAAYEGNRAADLWRRTYAAAMGALEGIGWRDQVASTRWIMRIVELADSYREDLGCAIPVEC